jgi:hypothetical protein
MIILVTGVQTCNRASRSDENRSPPANVTLDKWNSIQSAQPAHVSPEYSLNIPSFVNDFGNCKYKSTPARFEQIPFANAINPFFPPLNSSEPSPHKRHLDLHSPETQGTPNPNTNVNCPRKNDIFTEIQALVSLEVIKTRYTSQSCWLIIENLVLPRNLE